MHEKILPGFFRIGVPLPGSPLKELNAWLIKGKKRHLLVDNGFNTQAGEESLRAALSALEVELTDVDFFITHLHSDHNGLTHKLLEPGAAVYSGRVDGAHINAFISDQGLWKDSIGSLARHGFPSADLGKVLSGHPGKIYASSEPLEFTWVREGDELEYGGYVFRVVDTPGHTPGHQILHEQKKSFIISGDHVLGGISPNIVSWCGVEDSLGSYLKSLDKVDALGVKKSCPGHRAIVEDTQRRIEELREHHKNRLAEAFGIVRSLGEASAWQVAGRMGWNLRGAWPEYDVTQKCFAVGETVAHLDHLVLAGEIEKTVAEDDLILYRCAG